MFDNLISRFRGNKEKDQQPKPEAKTPAETAHEQLQAQGRLLLATAETKIADSLNDEWFQFVIKPEPFEGESTITTTRDERPYKINMGYMQDRLVKDTDNAKVIISFTSERPDENISYSIDRQGNQELHFTDKHGTKIIIRGKHPIRGETKFTGVSLKQTDDKNITTHTDFSLEKPRNKTIGSGSVRHQSTQANLLFQVNEYGQSTLDPLNVIEMTTGRPGRASSQPDGSIQIQGNESFTIDASQLTPDRLLNQATNLIHSLGNFQQNKATKG